MIPIFAVLFKSWAFIFYRLFPRGCECTLQLAIIVLECTLGSGIFNMVSKGQKLVPHIHPTLHMICLCKDFHLVKYSIEATGIFLKFLLDLWENEAMFGQCLLLEFLGLCSGQAFLANLNFLA